MFSDFTPRFLGIFLVDILIHLLFNLIDVGSPCHFHRKSERSPIAGKQANTIAKKMKRLKTSEGVSQR